MFDIIGKKKWYFIISVLLIVPGLVSLALFGLKLSIDFTGGSRVTYTFPTAVNQKTIADIRTSFEEENVVVSTIQPSGQRVIVRTAPINEQQNNEIQTNLRQRIPEFRQEEFETIGPVIGNETTLNALKSIVLASLLIAIYIAFSFRKVPKPTSSWRFGVCTIVALLHDVLVVLGLFSILGHFLHVEIDSLFITAILTVIGFSVHDTIVVFDRIRENLLRQGSSNFAKTVNDSILQTLTRSLNTSLTAILVLLTMLIFGGENIRWFIVALLVGIASGTFSSIFNAAPLLVAWQEWDEKRKKSK